jgi:HTH-type transcriptional regulator / antitoxin HigA
MIQNEYQYKITKSKIDDLARVLTTLATEAESLPPLMVEATRNGFQTQINRMQTELQEYDDLKAGKVEITMSSIASLAP